MSVSRIANRCALRMPGVASTSGRCTLSYHSLNSSSMPSTGVEKTRYVVTAMVRAPVRDRFHTVPLERTSVKAALHCRRGSIRQTGRGELDAALPRVGDRARLVRGLDLARVLRARA